MAQERFVPRARRPPLPAARTRGDPVDDRAFEPVEDEPSLVVAILGVGLIEAIPEAAILANVPLTGNWRARIWHR